MKDKSKGASLLLEMDEVNEEFAFHSSIEEAIEETEFEIEELNETIDSIKLIKSEADKTDYMLAAGMGALSGLIDLFLVGKPKESPVGNISDQWFENRTKDFARLTGWSGGRSNSASSAIRHLEKEFHIPYDQTGTGAAGAKVFGLTPSNHHFKSLGHNPNLLGLFFSILNQFKNTSTFISEGQLITLEKADKKFELVGHTIPGKLFAAFANWIGHIMSDISGSSSTKGRGMGIPSPLWTWINSVTAIKRKLNIPPSQFEEAVAELALTLFNEGYDIRFQVAQAIPVLLNEMLVRLAYSLRRMMHYFSNLEAGKYSFKELWAEVKPFGNPTVKRMLTVAHGTFCLIDLGDATIHGYTKGVGALNPVEFFLRLNIIGVGRFTISLYGEGKRAIDYQQAKKEGFSIQREKVIIEDYLKGLKILADRYDDEEMIQLIGDFKANEQYRDIFEESVALAEKRKVKDEKILKDKNEIDDYFRGGR